MRPASKLTSRQSGSRAFSWKSTPEVSTFGPLMLLDRTASRFEGWQLVPSGPTNVVPAAKVKRARNAALAHCQLAADAEGNMLVKMRAAVSVVSSSLNAKFQ